MSRPEACWTDVVAKTAQLGDVDGTLIVGQPLRDTLLGAAQRVDRVAQGGVRPNKLFVLDPTGLVDAVALLAGIAQSVVRVGTASAADRVRAEINDWKPDLVIGSAYLESGTPSVNPRSLLVNAADNVQTNEAAGNGWIELRTSGSTGEPKLVPLRWDQLVLSAQSVSESVELTTTDVTMVLMPLGHVHGLVASLLAPLLSGGTAICSPGFDAATIRQRIDDNGVTWISAVPTILRQLLLVSEQTGWLPSRPFRFLRSASSVLPVSLLEQLEDRFQCPVVEAYGMTEASHQICSGTPSDRRPGSVGRPSGPEVRIVGAEGIAVGSGLAGEVEIRGRSVTAGYVNHPQRGADEWLPTGDLGWLDSSGCLWLQGRRKEVINRGGETIAPRDVDDALTRVAGVLEAISFSVPDEHLGEAVGAVVVLDHSSPSERTIRHAMLRWVDHRHVPIALVVADKVPIGRTGKPDRGAARELWLESCFRGDGAETSEVASPGVLDAVRRAWRTVLGVTCGDDVHFLAAGGDSLRAMELESRFSDVGIALTIIDMASTPTIAAQARLAAALLVAANT